MILVELVDGDRVRFNELSLRIRKYHRTKIIVFSNYSSFRTGTTQRFSLQSTFAKQLIFVALTLSHGLSSSVYFIQASSVLCYNGVKTVDVL